MISEFTCGFTASACAMVCSRRSDALTSPDRTRAACAVASCHRSTLLIGTHPSRFASRKLAPSDGDRPRLLEQPSKRRSTKYKSYVLDSLPRRRIVAEDDLSHPPMDTVAQ